MPNSLYSSRSLDREVELCLEFIMDANEGWYSTHHHHIKVNTVRRFNNVICLVEINYWTLFIINLHEEHKQGWRVPATRKIHVTGDKSICKIRIHIIRSGWRITA